MEEKLKKSLYFPYIAYLSFFARIILIKQHIPVIAVTGSSGKTSTVDLIRTVLKEHATPFIYADHTNSAIGIPLYILHLNPTDINNRMQKYLLWLEALGLAPVHAAKSLFRKEKAAYYLFEEDSDRPGEMKHSAALLQAQFIIWLNSGTTHAAYHDGIVKKGRFESIEESVGYEFSQSIRNMQKHGLAIINTDDPMIDRFKKAARGNSIEIGRKSPYVQLMEYSTDGLETIFSIHINKKAIIDELWMYQLHETMLRTWPEDMTIHIHQYLLPDHYYYIFASAIILSLYLHIPYTTFMNAVAKYKLPPGRMTIFEGINSSYLIDSSYNNANPQSLIETLELLAQYEQSIAILGDMRELGDETQEEHVKIAKEIIKMQIGKVFLVGPAMSSYTYPYLIKHGYKQAFAYETTKEFKDTLIKEKFKQIDKNSIVLIKGSQNTIFLESIVELLLKDKSNVAYLCRRGKVWDERRISLGL